MLFFYLNDIQVKTTVFFTRFGHTTSIAPLKSSVYDQLI